MKEVCLRKSKSNTLWMTLKIYSLSRKYNIAVSKVEYISFYKVFWHRICQKFRTDSWKLVVTYWIVASARENDTYMYVLWNKMVKIDSNILKHLECSSTLTLCLCERRNKVVIVELMKQSLWFLVETPNFSLYCVCIKQ